MAKINNTSLYSLKQAIELQDFLLATDKATGKTISYELSTLLQHIIGDASNDKLLTDIPMRIENNVLIVGQVDEEYFWLINGKVYKHKGEYSISISSENNTYNVYATESSNRPFVLEIKENSIENIKRDRIFLASFVVSDNQIRIENLEEELTSEKNKITVLEADNTSNKTEISTIKTNVGDLSKLTTTAKSNLVGSINELNNIIGSLGGGFIPESITPTSSAPTVTNGYWAITQPGTYTNFGNVVLPANNFGFIFKNGNNFSIQSVEMPMLSVEGKVEENDLRAVSGGEVFNFINGNTAPIIESIPITTSGTYYNTGGEASSTTMNRTERFVVKKGQRVEFGVNVLNNTSTNSAVFIASRNNTTPDYDIIHNIKVSENANTWVEQFYTATEDCYVGITNDKSNPFNEPYVRLITPSESSALLRKIETSDEGNVKFNGEGTIGNPLTANVAIPSQDVVVDNKTIFKIGDELKASGGNSSNTSIIDIPLNQEIAYYNTGVTGNSNSLLSNERLFLKKGEKIMFGVNTFPNPGNNAIVVISRKDTPPSLDVIYNVKADDFLNQYYEGQYIATEDCYVGVSNLKSNLHGTPYFKLIKDYTLTIDFNTFELLKIRNNNINQTTFLDSTQKILISGQSFSASHVNGWFEVLCEKLGVTGINESYGGERIDNVAARLQAGTLLTQTNLNETGLLMIMHSHNKDVYTMGDITVNDVVITAEQQRNFTAEQYEALNWTRLTSTVTGWDGPDFEFAAVWDYVLKKIQTIYYAQKDVTGSPYYGSRSGKPFNLLVTTSWQDNRVKFNTSIRQLAYKWGFVVCRFDDNIGFSRNQPFINGEQQSLLYARVTGDKVDTEVIDGITYAWHPLGGETQYIQKRLAMIAKKCIEII